MDSPPAVVGMSAKDVDTPALVVDLDALDRNIAKMAGTAKSAGVRLRPHAKCFKSAPIAQLLLAKGAVGVCCQKVGEAEVMAAGGVGDILVTNEIWGRSKLERLAALGHTVQIRVCADDEQNLTDLSAVATAYGVVIDVLVEINVSGNLQCGVEAGAPAVELAKRITELAGLTFGGLQAYDGPAQHTRAYADRRDSVARAIDMAAKTKALLEAAGLRCERITGSGTGTYELEAASGVYTELQAGSYLFMDVDYSKNCAQDGGPYRDFEHSLFVLATVMSRPVPDAGILDAGIKSSSVDSGPPQIEGRPDLEWVGGGDEHAKFKSRTGSAFPFANGDKVRLVPGHCDPTVNLYDWFVGVRKGRVEAIWPIAARGLNR